MALFSINAQAADGTALYKQHCAKCHGDAGQADTWRGYMLFAQNFSSATFQAGNSDEDILAAINRGPRLMPAYESTLTLAERKALVTAVRSFAAQKSPAATKPSAPQSP